MLTFVFVILLVKVWSLDITGTTNLPTTVLIKPIKPTDELQKFLKEYDKYCNDHLESNVTDDRSVLCPCISPLLIGRTNVSSIINDKSEKSELELYESGSGGTWYPLTCIPRHKVAIIVPFRDREKHLKKFLKVVHSMLRRQLLYYTIFIVEQNFPKVFNKAALMNAGFKEASSLNDYDCFLFHDVDMLPEDDRNFYTCSRTPRHVGSFVNKWNYNLLYYSLVGGAIAFKKSHFETINGYANAFYGWGGEDDNMYRRIRAANFSLMRFPKAVAKYTMIKHHRDDGNPQNSKRYSIIKPNKDDGLSSLQYHVEKTEVRPLYVWMFISLPASPPHLITKDMLTT